MTDSTAARAIIDTSLVWDNHGCMPLRPHEDIFLPQLELPRQASTLSH